MTATTAAGPVIQAALEALMQRNGLYGQAIAWMEDYQRAIQKLGPEVLQPLRERLAQFDRAIRALEAYLGLEPSLTASKRWESYRAEQHERQPTLPFPVPSPLDASGDPLLT